VEIVFKKGYLSRINFVQSAFSPAPINVLSKGYKERLWCGVTTGVGYDTPIVKQDHSARELDAKNGAILLKCVLICSKPVVNQLHNVWPPIYEMLMKKLTMQAPYTIFDYLYNKNID